MLKRKRELVVLFLLSSGCLVTVNVLWLFLRVPWTVNVLWLFLRLPWVGLPCLIVVFSDHTHLLFGLYGLKQSLSGSVIKCNLSKRLI